MFKNDLLTHPDFVLALRAIAEPTRLRILILCAHSELMVTDLNWILEQSQPRISRHLKVMHEAGVLERQHEGTRTWFRAVRHGVIGQLVQMMVDSLSPEDPDNLRDMARLDEVSRSWEEKAKSYFARNFANWDKVRASLIDEPAVDRALLEETQDWTLGRMLDIGTGTGHMLSLLAKRAESAIGMDRSREMLLAARSRLHKEKLTHCQLRMGLMDTLPFDDDAFDLVSMHLVLLYEGDVQKALNEAGRVTAAHGKILITDFGSHDQHNIMDQLGHQRAGFDPDTLQHNLEIAGFTNVTSRTLTHEGLPVWLWSGQKTLPIERTIQ